MSIFQDFESIRKSIGCKKYDMIEKYLENICPQNNIDKYFKEMNTIWKFQPIEWNDRADKLKKKYKIVLLDDVLFKNKEWAKYETWYNENCLNRKVEILETWETDYDDIRCNAILYQNGNKVGNIVASYDESSLRYSIGDENSEMNEEFVKDAFKNLIYDDFNSYSDLPKISKCSKLLQSIYDDVCSSESTMCHISKDDWNNYYSDTYSENDINNLLKEIKKYSLEKIITIDDNNFKIIGYGDLETRFINDREVSLDYGNDMEL